MAHQLPYGVISSNLWQTDTPTSHQRSKEKNNTCSTCRAAQPETHTVKPITAHIEPGPNQDNTPHMSGIFSLVSTEKWTHVETKQKTFVHTYKTMWWLCIQISTVIVMWCAMLEECRCWVVDHIWPLPLSWNARTRLILLPLHTCFATALVGWSVGLDVLRLLNFLLQDRVDTSIYHAPGGQLDKMKTAKDCSSTIRGKSELIYVLMNP